MLKWTLRLLALAVLGGVVVIVTATLNDPRRVRLSDDKQDFIWDVERFTFQLEQKFGAALKGEWRQQDSTALEARFQPAATVDLAPDDSSFVVRRSEWWTEEAYSRAAPAEGAVVADSGGRSAAGETPADLARQLCGWAARFGEMKSVGMRVLSLRAEGTPAHALKAPPRPVSDWRLTVLLTASGTDPEGRPFDHESTHSVGARFHDVKTILAGRILTDWRVDDVRWRTASQQMFGEVTANSGLTELEIPDNWRRPPDDSRSFWASAAVEDFDGDDLLDVAITSATGRRWLMRNVDGLRFEDVTTRVGIPRVGAVGDVLVAHAFDMDNDDDSDLLLGGALFRNDGGMFVDVTVPCGLRFLDSAINASTADFDQDGLLDLYILHDKSRRPKNVVVGYLDDSTTGAENRLWRNLGNGRFEDVTDSAGVGNGLRHSFAGLWLYANDDPRPDLFVINDFGRNALYLNEGAGRFRENAERAGVGAYANGMGGAVGDLDNNGTSEIYIGNMFSKMGRRIIEHVAPSDYPEGVFEQIVGSCAGNRMYRLSADGEHYDDVSEQLGVNGVGWAFAPILADFDSDGRLDIYATSGFISVDRTKPDG